LPVSALIFNPSVTNTDITSKEQSDKNNSENIEFDCENTSEEDGNPFAQLKQKAFIT
jgi:hypothetical protein